MNRRERVETLKRYGEYELQKSYAHLEQSSPIRRGPGGNGNTSSFR